MSKHRADEPPLPGGAGAGGEGRRRKGAHVDVARHPDGPTSQPSSTREEGSLGWTPKFGQTRQKQFVRANGRAKRLRREMTPSEKKLWSYLRHEPNSHFRRQVAMRNFVYDFGDYTARLLIELDGGAHEYADVAMRDAQKEAIARDAGFHFLRFTNADVEARAEWVLDQVRIYLRAPPPPQTGGEHGATEEL